MTVFVSFCQFLYFQFIYQSIFALPSKNFTLPFFVRKFVQSQTLSREKLLKRLLYKKCVRKMLMKSTPRQPPLLPRPCHGLDYIFTFFRPGNPAQSRCWKKLFVIIFCKHRRVFTKLALWDASTNWFQLKQIFFSKQKNQLLLFHYINVLKSVHGFKIQRHNLDITC